MKKLFTLFALVSLFALAACGPPVVVPDPTWTSVRDDVFIPSCSCHTGSTPSGNLALDVDSPNSLVDIDASASAYDGWKLIVAGAPEQSLIYVRLNGGNDDASAMPPASDGLHPDVVEAIGTWIAEGATE